MPSTAFLIQAAIFVVGTGEFFVFLFGMWLAGSCVESRRGTRLGVTGFALMIVTTIAAAVTIWVADLIGDPWHDTLAGPVVILCIATLIGVAVASVIIYFVFGLVEARITGRFNL